jgi:transcriptional regulator with XRE-family HTH domain
MQPRSNRYAELLTVFAANVRALRTQRQWTQEFAASQFGMHSRHLQKIESGNVNFTAHTIARIAAAFDVEPARLFQTL